MGFYIRDIRVDRFRSTCPSRRRACPLAYAVSASKRAARQITCIWAPRPLRPRHVAAHAAGDRCRRSPVQSPLPRLHEERAAVSPRCAILLCEMDAKRRTARLAPAVGFLGAVAAAGAAFLAPDIAASMQPEWPSWAPLLVPGGRYRSRRGAQTRFLSPRLSCSSTNSSLTPNRSIRSCTTPSAIFWLAHAVWHVEAAGAGGGLEAKRRCHGHGAARRTAQRRDQHRLLPLWGRETLYFFPDRALVFAPQGVGAVSSAHSVRRETHDSLRGGRCVLSDAEERAARGSTSTGAAAADRRFNNCRVPLALYDELHLRRRAVNEPLQLSRSGAGERLGRSIARLGREVRYSAEPNGAAGAANDQPSVAAPESPSDLRWTRVSEAG